MKTCKHFLLAATAIALLGQVATSLPGWQHLGDVTSVEVLPNGVELKADSAKVRVVAVSECVIRVRLAPEGEFPPDTSWAVVPAERSTVRVTVNDSEESVEFATRQVKVRVFKSPLRIAFLDLNGSVIVEDAPSRTMAWGRGRVRVWKTMPPDEYYYGLGEKAGPMNRRGHAFTMWNTDAFGWQESTDPLYKSIPFFLALRKGRAYGIYFDNTYLTRFDFGNEARDSYTFAADGGELDYYFIYGPHPKKVLEEYAALTGRTPLPPRWSLGYQQCRYSYYPEARVREVARLFREKKIPCDVIYLDIDYQDENRPFTVDRQRFPNFEGMIRDLSTLGFKIIAITDLHIKKEPRYAPYDSGMAGDHFVKNPDGTVYVGQVWPGESVFPDFTREETRSWWGNLYREFVNIGIHGFWNDMNEPAVFDGPGKTMPLDTVHRVNGRQADHREIHNVLGMQNARATFEGLRRLRPSERPFVLTRAAFAGAQRYAATWTGDNTSSWNHLRLMVPTLLGLGLSGYPYVGADIGGFAGSPPADLLTRWIQAGVFTPLFRNHTMKGSADQEPWVHGLEHEAIRRRYIELRYRLLPYIYTSLEETTRTGVPLMRPLFLEYPEAEALYENDRQFLFGRDLLVAAKLWETTDPYDVSLPDGAWYDYWTGKKHPGGQTVSASPALDEVPLYVRAGAILPQQPVVQHTDEVPSGPLELRVYPGPDCQGSLYLDDGKSYSYTRGEYLRIDYSCGPAPESLRIDISSHQGSYTPWWKELRLEVFGVEQVPREVRVGPRVVTSWSHDPARNTLTLTAPDSAAGWDIRIQY